MPSILPPSADKIEIDKLMDDIPKFYEWISSSSAVAWDIFLQRELKDLLSVHDGPWMMEEIFTACQTSRATTHTSETEEQDEALANLFAASVNPVCEVRTMSRSQSAS